MGIAHDRTDTVDLLRPAAQGRSRLRITTSAPLNRRPDLATATSLFTVFALAEHASAALGKPAEVVFDVGDNAPADVVRIGGERYSRSVADLMRAGDLDQDETFAGFRQLLDQASARSAVPYVLRVYDDYQALAPVRECLSAVAGNLEEFRPIVAPAGQVRIRPRCPLCRLVERSARSLRISVEADGAVRLASRCPLHGAYVETVTPTGDGWYDPDAAVGSLLKGFLLVTERDLYDACTVSVDDRDLAAVWHAPVLGSGLATLGIDPSSWPVCLFTPPIVDASGNRLAGRGDCGQLPSPLLDLTLLLGEDDEVLNRLWAEVSNWIQEPGGLHRSYSIEHLRRRLRLGGAIAC